mmetsp:Transcript_47266/g.70340  ORF Transcript_47266/g.70340 Transcript_47266/m.70340 type:complete len:238 (-) Transcript_47266:1228-1941(-)
MTHRRELRRDPSGEVVVRQRDTLKQAKLSKERWDGSSQILSPDFDCSRFHQIITLIPDPLALMQTTQPADCPWLWVIYLRVVVETLDTLKDAVVAFVFCRLSARPPGTIGFRRGEVEVSKDESLNEIRGIWWQLQWIRHHDPLSRLVRGCTRDFDIGSHGAYKLFGVFAVSTSGRSGGWCSGRCIGGRATALACHNSDNRTNDHNDEKKGNGNGVQTKATVLVQRRLRIWVVFDCSR